MSTDSSKTLYEQWQKHPPKVFYEKLYLKTFVLESLFNKVAGLKAYNLIKKRLQHSCFPVNIAKFVRTPILKFTNVYFYNYRKYIETTKKIGA